MRASRKTKGPSKIKGMPKSKRLQELASNDYVDPATKTDINDGHEAQARDGSNIRTLAEEEREANA